MKIWKVICSIDNGVKIYQKTQNIIAPTKEQAIKASLNYWENESYDTNATLIKALEYKVQENDTIILNN